jgi:hypothetical protein
MVRIADGVKLAGTARNKIHMSASLRRRTGREGSAPYPPRWNPGVELEIETSSSSMSIPTPANKGVLR